VIRDSIEPKMQHALAEFRSRFGKGPILFDRDETDVK
jgi:hypothetical protein